MAICHSQLLPWQETYSGTSNTNLLRKSRGSSVPKAVKLPRPAGPPAQALKAQRTLRNCEVTSVNHQKVNRRVARFATMFLTLELAFSFPLSLAPAAGQVPI